MKIEDVPQDNIRTMDGRRKSLYATDADGRYCRVATSGWKVEEIVLDDVLSEYDALAREALTAVNSGKVSPIAYFMYRRFMDPPTLARAVGYGQWRVKRHLRPEIFCTLPDTALKRYADVFQVSLETLKSPERA